MAEKFSFLICELFVKFVKFLPRNFSIYGTLYLVLTGHAFSRPCHCYNTDLNTKYLCMCVHKHTSGAIVQTFFVFLCVALQARTIINLSCKSTIVNKRIETNTCN